MQSFRIFVSSPRDVGSERALAAGVIDRLKFEFRGLIEIVPIFWEQMPMRATDTFQAQIPQAAEADLCIFILWSWFELSLGNVKPNGGGDRHSRDHYVNRSR
jgi:hypothetical protein